jgi:putative hemolysin
MTTTKNMFIILGLCIVAGIFIAGCTQPMTPAQTPAVTPTKDTRLNQAAVYCGQIGGTPNTVKNVDGSEYGMCTFLNGTSCEEWALFRNEGCKAAFTVSSTTAAPMGMANPASVNCGKIGGTTEIKKNPDGSEYGMCTFQNGTSCEEWALFRNEGCKAK